jgi:hypothetical protein
LNSLPGPAAKPRRSSIMSKDCPVSASLTANNNTKLLKIKQDAEKNFPPPQVPKK